MTIPLERVFVDGDVLDVLDDCDQLSIGLGRLRRQGRISEDDWSTSKQSLAEICIRVEASLTYRTRADRP